MAKGDLGIFYIDTGKAYFYSVGGSGAAQIPLPADVMSYFDIINREKFLQILQTLLTTNKIPPMPVLILIAPGASYEKDYTGKVTDEVNADIQQFLDTVPFEKVMSRIYKVGDNTKIVVTNKDMYEAIRHGFERMHFTIVGVVSLSLLQKVMPEIGTSLNFEQIASKYDALKQYSFITTEEINNPQKTNPNQPEQKPKPNPLRLYGLVGVFVVLIGVLVFMVVTTLQPAPKPIPLRQVPAALVTTPTPLIMPTVAVTKTGTSSGQVFQGPKITTAPVTSH